MAFKLTNVDLLAIENGDSHYLNNQGAKYYQEEDYSSAIEYYRLAAAMGNVHSICNLGYCYMYARSIRKNMSLAMAYFRIAAHQKDVDALYKLGNIYENGAAGIEKDEELAVYYYTLALQVLGDQKEDVWNYPSLFLSVAKAHMPGGFMMCNIRIAYSFLKIALHGFEDEKRNGIQYHLEALEETMNLINDHCFDGIRDEMDAEDEEDEE